MKQSYYSGLSYVFLATLIWGLIQVIYFNHIGYISPFEIVAHRGFWSFVILFFVILITKDIKSYLSIFKDRTKIIALSVTGLLISSNWFLFILSVVLNKVQDSAMGYFISPIFSVALGYIFFKEKFSLLQLISLILILIAIINLIINNGSIPWIALSLATTWSIYGLLRKKIEISSQVGLLFEMSILAPFFIIYILYIHKLGISNFTFKNMNSFIFLVGAGIVTATPLFFFNLGVKKIPLSLAGLIFYLVPTLQFLTSVIFLNEYITIIKLFSFFLIWIAVIVFLFESFKYN